MKKQQVSPAPDVEFNEATGILTITGNALAMCERAAERLGVTVDEIATEAIREGLMPENWPAVVALAKQRQAVEA